jgi:hypothetical protein
VAVGVQIAEQRGHRSPDGLQHLLPRAKWDADAVRDEVRGYALGATSALSPDLAEAVQQLHDAGVELLGEPGPTWQHFRSPDGNVYEVASV